MEHTLHLDIHAQVLPGPIRITTEGCLTQDSYHSLLEICDHAIALQGCPSICVDLLGLKHLEPAALQAVQRHLAQYKTDRTLPEVSVLAPTLPRYCATAGSNHNARAIPAKHWPTALEPLNQRAVQSTSTSTDALSKVAPQSQATLLANR